MFRNVLEFSKKAWIYKFPIGFYINLWLFLFTSIVFISGMLLLDGLIVDKESPGWGSYVLAGWLVFTVGTLLHLLFYRVIRRKNPAWIKSVIDSFSS